MIVISFYRCDRKKWLCERQKSGRDGHGSFAVPSPFATPRYVPDPHSREAHGEVTRVGGSGRTATLACARRGTPFWRDGVYLPRHGASGVLPHALSLAQGAGYGCVPLHFCLAVGKPLEKSLSRATVFTPLGQVFNRLGRCRRPPRRAHPQSVPGGCLARRRRAMAALDGRPVGTWPTCHGGPTAPRRRTPSRGLPTRWSTGHCPGTPQ